VHFFTVGNLGGRTLVIYAKKKSAGSSWSRSTRLLAKDAPQLDSLFRVLEPVIGKINKRTEAPGSRFNLLSQRSEWFRVYRVGFTLHYPLRPLRC